MSEEEKNKRLLLAGKLTNGNATQAERDAALAELLLTLWDADTLNEHIDKRIDEKCKACAKVQWHPVAIELIRCKLFWAFAITALGIGGSNVVQSLASMLARVI